MALIQPTPPGLPSAPCRTYSVYITHRPIGVACNDVNYVVNHGGPQIVSDLDQSIAPSTSDYTYNSFNWKKLATGVVANTSGQFTVRIRPSHPATSCASGNIFADAILIIDDLGRKYVIDDIDGNAVVASGSGSWSTDTNAANYNGQARFVSKATAGTANYYFDWTFDEADYFTDFDGDGIYDDCDIDDDNDGVPDVDETTLGKIANPFTSLEQARANVFKAGIYYFNLSGNRFSTYVNEAGYVLVAVDYGDGTGALAASTKLGLTKLTYGRGILNSTTLAALGTVSELRLSTNSTSAGGVDVTTSNSTLISRVKANQSLHKGVADNAINETWSGVNQIYLRRDATGTTSTTNNLNNNIAHVAGNSGSFNWIPATGNQRVQWSSGEIANDNYMALWVRGNTSGVTQDSDNDGTPNHRDLDSDDDGCSDAFEAGATTDTTTDYQFAATPDDNENGLNDDVENGTTGSINYTSTYTHYALNEDIEACLDSDSDGVSDLIDLDDDNDGVLDLTECNEAHILDMGSFDGLTATVGTGVVGYASLPGTSTSVKLTLVSNGSSGSITARASGAAFNDRDPSGDGSAIQIGSMDINNTQESYVQFEFEVPVYNLSFVIADIDGGGGSGPEVTHVEASLNGDIFMPNASISSSGPIPTQTGTGFSGTGANSSNAMLVEYTEPVDKLVIKVTGSNTSNVTLTQSLFNLSYTVCPDTDGDGTTDELDLDSDDDGCSDAYESGATTDLTTDYQFAATPDANSNGLNDNVENGTTGSINYTSTYAHYALNEDIEACLDSDGDGMPDLEDIDDDNDGVLDATECTNVYILDFGAFNGLAASVGEVATGIQPLPGTGSDVKLRLTAVGNSGSLSAKLSGATFNDRDPSGDRSAIQIGALNITNAQESKVEIEFGVPVYNLNFVITDIDGGNLSGPERTIIEASSNGHIYTPTATLVADGPLPTQTGNEFSGTGANSSNVMRVNYTHGVDKLVIKVKGSTASAVSLTQALFNLSYTLCEDTDGDGTVNRLDLDSDDDGCSDAYEAGATTDLSTDYQFTATPDANGNGLNDDVEDGVSGNVDYSSTYIDYAIDARAKACIDTDGDGVPDVDDVDDDNDGVLDADEMVCGSVGYPFTSLEQARASVTTSGVYYFNLSGNKFSTYVDSKGYVLVAVDYGDGVGALPLSSSLGLSKAVNGRGVVSPATLAALGGVEQIRLSSNTTNSGGLDVTTTNATLIGRLKANKTLHGGVADNSINDDWVGISQERLTGDATCTTSYADNLTISIAHICGNASSFHWVPDEGYQKVRFNNGEISDSDYLAIWVRGDESGVACDFDGDGTPNHLDLDSDDDGCSDAFEAGATTDTTTDYQFATTPDANGNGLNDDVEDGTSGNVVYAHTSTYAAYALNDDFKLCVDTDGDSVADIYDIDDDNDGTPDNAECYDSPTVLDWSENTWAPGAMSNTYTVLGNTFHFTITDPSGAMLDSPPAPVDLPVSGPNYQGGFDSIDDQLIVAADINTLGTSNLITTTIEMGVSGVGLENVSFKLFDVDGNTASGKVYEEQYTIRGYLNGVEVAPALIGNSGYQTISGNVINGLIEAPTTGASSGNGTVEVYFAQAVDRVEIDFGIAPGGDINGSRPGFGIYDIVFFSDCDKDGDGMPNHLDLDSDGDGCSDAYEAGATTDLSTDYQFATTPDANGNGLNDNVENGNSNQINYTSTYGDFALYAALKACEDYDGDSVFNGIDLDDDNDGVLDTDEGADCTLTYSFSGTLDGSRDRGPENNDQNRDFVFGDNYAFNLNFDCEIGIEVSTTFGDENSGRSGLVSVGGVVKSINTGVNEFQTITHVPAISDNYSVQVSGTDVTMTQLTVTDAYGNILAQFDFGTTGSPVAAGYIGVDETLTSGTVTVSPMTVDTDGDGAFNLLDLDSDDDGCSDAYEGGSTEDLSTDFQHPATPDVNSNGLNDAVEDGTTGNINYALTYDEYALNDELQLCDCQFLWLKADAGTLNGASAAADGQAVNTWQDQTAWRTNDATDVNIAAPTYRDNAADYINYNPVVEFDGFDDGLDFGDDYLFVERAGMTWLAVIMPDVTTATKQYQFIHDFGTVSGSGYGMVYSSHNATVYTPTGFGGVFNTINHSRGVQATLMRMKVTFQDLQEMVFNGAGTPETSEFNSIAQITAAEIGENPSHTAAAGPFTIGRQSKAGGLASNDGRLFDGKIAEIIGFCNPLTPSQLSRFESYLAVKWGITQDNSDGGEYGDYVDHDGTVVWDASEYAAHHYNVAGIGRDDAISLNQKQSKSVNADAILSIGLDANTNGLESSNAGNTSTFSSDKSYMLWGHDNQPLGNPDITEFDPLQVKGRLNREWRATKTGDIGAVTLEFDVTSLPGPTGVGTNDESQIVLLLDADGDFSAGATVVTQSYVVASDGVVKFSANIPDGAYFTLGTSEESALPITLVDFEVRQTEDGAVELYWTTASEVNNSHFVIERSTDGYGFSEIGFKTGAVNSTELVEYQYFDLQPPAGKAYYRLKQVDINGAYEYSPVRSINITGEQQFNVVVYPNPVHSGQDLVLEFNGSRIEGRAELEVFGVNSTSVYKSTFEFNEGDKRAVVVPTNGFSQGLYIVTISWNNGSERIFKRVVVH
ncbi:hypothetical protein [Roseivirga pacifica]|uniref:hypothetical protein n=1 Tax=Roseivirga pacifica TaxID=1267423 RepID=UPI00227A3041|nr:hypothetical protein [Roseivirga pacifica]